MVRCYYVYIDKRRRKTNLIHVDREKKPRFVLKTKNKLYFINLNLFLDYVYCFLTESVQIRFPFVTSLEPNGFSFSSVLKTEQFGNFINTMCGVYTLIV